MTVQSNDRRKEYDGNGVAVEFNGPYLFQGSQLDVFLVEGGVATLVPTNQYQIKNLGRSGGTRVIMDTAPTSLQVLLLLRTVAFDQPTDITNQGAFLPETLEKAFDYEVMQIQQVADGVSRSLKAADTVVGFNAELPPWQPGAPLIWDYVENRLSNGDPIGTGDLLLRPDLASSAVGKGASLVVYRRQDGTATTVQANSREKLAADRTYYVRTDGNDSNDGLANTIGGAFLTLQRAVDVVYNSLDFNGKNVVIQVAAGTYAAGCVLQGPHVGKGDLYFIGDQTTPANVVVSTTAANDHCFALYEGASAIIRGFKVATAGAGACCILAYTGSDVNVGSIEYGACANMHNEIGSESVGTFFPPYAISGGAVGHWHTGSPAQINVGLMAATITNTPHFSSYFAGTAGGFIVCKEFNWTGSATGSRYLAHKGGVIDGNAGLDPFLPGNSDGRVATGGIAKAGQTFPVDISADINVSDSVRIGSMNTGTGVFTPALVFTSAATPTATFAFNGTSYNLGDTTFGNSNVVDCAVGTQDGTSLRNTGAGILFQGSTNLAHYGQVRRRGNDGPIWFWYRDTTNVGNISVTTTATAYNTSSDARLKQAIDPASYNSDWIKRIADQVMEFEFKADPSTRVVGAIAQKLNEVAPEAVTAGDDDMSLEPHHPGFQAWGVDPAKLVWKLILEVNRLRQRLDELTK